jgi:hypothetical protein
LVNTLRTPFTGKYEEVIEEAKEGSFGVLKSKLYRRRRTSQ